MFILSCAVKHGLQNQPQERRGTRCRSRSGRDDRKMPPAGLKHVASILIPSGSALKHDVTSLPLKPPSLTEFPYLATPDMIAIPSQGLKEQPYPHAVSQKSSVRSLVVFRADQSHVITWHSSVRHFTSFTNRIVYLIRLLLPRCFYICILSHFSGCCSFNDPLNHRVMFDWLLD